MKNKRIDNFDSNINRNEGSRNYNIFSRIDNYLTKLALYEIRKVLIDEKNKGYYRNFTNIEEFIEFECEKVADGNGCEYDSVKNIVYWSNGFYEINSINRFKSLSRKQ